MIYWQDIKIYLEINANNYIDIIVDSDGNSNFCPRLSENNKRLAIWNTESSLPSITILHIHLVQSHTKALQGKAAYLS